MDARDQPRLQLALDLRRERAAALQQEKAERAARAQQERAIALKEKENAALLAVIAKQDKTLESLYVLQTTNSPPGRRPRVRLTQGRRPGGESHRPMRQSGDARRRLIRRSANLPLIVLDVRRARDI